MRKKRSNVDNILIGLFLSAVIGISSFAIGYSYGQYDTYRKMNDDISIKDIYRKEVNNK